MALPCIYIHHASAKSTPSTHSPFHLLQTALPLFLSFFFVLVYGGADHIVRIPCVKSSATRPFFFFCQRGFLTALSDDSSVGSAREDVDNIDDKEVVRATRSWRGGGGGSSGNGRASGSGSGRSNGNGNGSGSRRGSGSNGSGSASGISWAAATAAASGPPSNSSRRVAAMSEDDSSVGSVGDDWDDNDYTVANSMETGNPTGGGRQGGGSAQEDFRLSWRQMAVAAGAEPMAGHNSVMTSPRSQRPAVYRQRFGGGGGGIHGGATAGAIGSGAVDSAAARVGFGSRGWGWEKTNSRSGRGGRSGDGAARYTRIPVCGPTGSSGLIDTHGCNTKHTHARARA